MLASWACTPMQAFGVLGIGGQCTDNLTLSDVGSYLHGTEDRLVRGPDSVGMVDGNNRGSSDDPDESNHTIFCSQDGCSEWRLHINAPVSCQPRFWGRGETTSDATCGAVAGYRIDVGVSLRGHGYQGADDYKTGK
ncbi:Uncharacterised protein [Corynebacterium renale]|nr:Uncharacterised protein [Corynebacterium renale]